MADTVEGGSVVESAEDGGNQPWKRFDQLLVREREAAARADVEALASLQVAKRQLLDDLKSHALPDGVLEEIHRKARLNVTLIRQLVQCLGAMAGESQQGTYDAQGQRGSQARASWRGSL